MYWHTKGILEKFFAIDIIHIDENIFKVSQTFLIDRIISLLNIDKKDYGVDTNAKSTPVGKPLLHKDLYGKPRKEAWNYKTAVGMLNYLQSNSRA